MSPQDNQSKKPSSAESTTATTPITEDVYTKRLDIPTNPHLPIFIHPPPASTSPNAHQEASKSCCHCHKPATRRCSACCATFSSLAWYCTSTCQKAQWPAHKLVCKSARLYTAIYHASLSYPIDKSAIGELELKHGVRLDEVIKNYLNNVGPSARHPHLDTATAELRPQLKSMIKNLRATTSATRYHREQRADAALRKWDRLYGGVKECNVPFDKRELWTSGSTTTTTMTTGKGGFESYAGICVYPQDFEELSVRAFLKMYGPNGTPILNPWEWSDSGGDGGGNGSGNGSGGCCGGGGGGGGGNVTTEGDCIHDERREAELYNVRDGDGRRGEAESSLSTPEEKEVLTIEMLMGLMT